MIDKVKEFQCVDVFSVLNLAPKAFISQTEITYRTHDHAQLTSCHDQSTTKQGTIALEETKHGIGPNSHTAFSNSGNKNVLHGSLRCLAVTASHI